MVLDRSWPIRGGAAEMYMPSIPILTNRNKKKTHINEVFYSYRKKGPRSKSFYFGHFAPNELCSR